MVAWNLPGPQGNGSVPSRHRFRVRKQGQKNLLRGHRVWLCLVVNSDSHLWTIGVKAAGGLHSTVSETRATIAEYSLCAPPHPNSNYSNTEGQGEGFTTNMQVSRKRRDQGCRLGPGGPW